MGKPINTPLKGWSEANAPRDVEVTPYLSSEMTPSRGSISGSISHVALIEPN
jgi:hypothetical protein